MHTLSEHQFKAMEALFQLHDAFEQGDLTLIDLHEMFEVFLKSGHDMMRLELAMVGCALDEAAKCTSAD